MSSVVGSGTQGSPDVKQLITRTICAIITDTGESSTKGPSNGEHWRERCQRHTATSPPCSKRSSGCVWATSCQWHEPVLWVRQIHGISAAPPWRLSRGQLRNSRPNMFRASAQLATSYLTAHSHDSDRPPMGNQCASGNLDMQALSRTILGACQKCYISRWCFAYNGVSTEFTFTVWNYLTHSLLLLDAPVHAWGEMISWLTGGGPRVNRHIKVC